MYSRRLLSPLRSERTLIAPARDDDRWWMLVEKEPGLS